MKKVNFTGQLAVGELRFNQSPVLDTPMGEKMGYTKYALHINKKTM